nr:cytochrome P450 76C1-like [Tanacetum cinerariifolium]
RIGISPNDGFGPIGTKIDINEIAFKTEVNVVISMLWGRSKSSEMKDYSCFEDEFREVEYKIMALLVAPNISDFLSMLSWSDLQGFKREMKKQFEYLDRILDTILRDFLLGFLIASRFPTPPLACSFFSLRATVISSSKLSRDQTSNLNSSTNPTPKGRIRRSSKQKVEMLRAPTEGCAEAIVVPPILAEQFELKHSLINMMTLEQLFGLKKDNPHDHI